MRKILPLLPICLGRASLRQALAILALLAAILATPAYADDAQDCEKLSGDAAIAACTRVIAKNPKDAVAFHNRGLAWSRKYDFDRAITDYDMAIQLLRDPQDLAVAYTNRGGSFFGRSIVRSISKDDRATEDERRALQDLDKAITLDSKIAEAYYTRSLYWSKKDASQALEDAKKASSLEPKNKRYAFSLSEAEKAFAASATTANTPAPSPTLASERRVALVIGNAAYAGQTPLANPRNDAALVANTLRSAGFQEVIEKTDLDTAGMIRAVQDFAALADNADWSVVYYSGHGIQANGRNYLIPVNATLRQERDLELEAVEMGRVSLAMAQSRSLRLLILDMCRTSPYVAAMARNNSGKSATRGLAAPDLSDAGELVVFAAKDGQEALDGEGANSPFAEATARRLAMPGLDIRRAFDFVRDDVMKATGRKQQPFTYGSLPPSDFVMVKR